MAGAVASIAFGKPAPLVDGNVERVLARVFAYGQPAKSTAAQRQFWNWAAELMPRRRCGDHNQSLMELGARVCTPRNPQCLFCPLAPICAGKTSPERYPVIPRASAVVLEKVFAVVLRGKKIWLLDPESDGLWSGLPRLPEFDSSWMSECGIHGSLQVGITQYRIRATIAAARPTRAAPRHGRWHLLEALQTLTLPAPHRRMIARVLVAR
jgi:A/G-specific adenine glycosylase